MKVKFLYPLVIALALLGLVACGNQSEKVVNDLHEFVEETMTEASEFSEDEWVENSNQFDALMDNIEENYDQMTPEQRKQVMEELGRYVGLQTKNTMKSAAERAEQFMEALPALFDGFRAAFKDSCEDEE